MKKKDKEYVERMRGTIKAYSNDELLAEVISDAGGDNQDGCFTEAGWAVYQIELVELSTRLKNSEFIENHLEAIE